MLTYRSVSFLKEVSGLYYAELKNTKNSTPILPISNYFKILNINWGLNFGHWKLVDWIIGLFYFMHKYSTDELVAQKPSEEDFRHLKRNPIVFILHNIRSLENVGLFFRLADALMVEKIYLTGYTGYPRQENDTRDERIVRHAESEINKTAIKIVPFVPWEHCEEIDPLLSKLRTTNLPAGRQGYQLIAVEQTDRSIDYRKAEYKFPLALIFGHERTGVEDELLEQCDLIVDIPMLGMGNSHNVAASGAIIASHLINFRLSS